MRYGAMVNCRISVRQAEQVATLARSCRASEAEVIRYALQRLFAADADALADDLAQELTRRDEEEQRQ